MLNMVVLPAPFGPISAVMLFASTAKEQPATAWMPPNAFFTSRISRRGKTKLERGATAARGMAPPRLISGDRRNAHQFGFGQRRSDVPGNWPSG
jgi:hypothetical protein